MERLLNVQEQHCDNRCCRADHDAGCHAFQEPTTIIDDDAENARAVDGVLISDGREIAERNCAVCHSIEKSGEGPREDIPPLREAISNFDIEALAVDFREHIQIGNEIMPEFDFSPLHTDALMAYLLTIETVEAE